LELRAEIRQWHAQIKQALLQVENQQLAEKNLPPWPPGTIVYIPGEFAQERPGQQTSRAIPAPAFQLYNLKVWCERYCVSLTFILSTLLRTYRFQRRRNPLVITLGLPAAMITGETARRRLEEAIIHEFPNQENFRAARQRQPEPPIKHIDYENPAQFVARYNQAILLRRKAYESVPECNRNFRKLKTHI